MQVNPGPALLRLARYYLQCDAIEVMYNTQNQGDKLKRGEAIVIKGIRGYGHEYMELLPSEEEVIAAESTEVDKHPAAGDTWLKGGAAMLRPHTRHATFRRGEIFSECKA